MWDRRELKTKARLNVKQNYWTIVLICFLFAFLFGEYGLTTSAITNYSDSRVSQNAKNSASKAENNRLSNKVANTKLSNDSITANTTKGVLSGMVEDAINAKSAVNSTYNTFKSFMGKNKLFSTLMSLLSLVLSILWLIFGEFLLKVGERRFFLENRNYHKSRASRILFLYKEKNIWNPAKTMLMREIFLTLWMFTIIGLPIKYYSYKMIPYILAENPNAKWRDVLNLSKAMMKGNKWRAFVVDLSFWYWHILQIATLGLIGLLYLNPYMRATEAELYTAIRAEAIEKALPHHEILNDKLLYEPEDNTLKLYPGLVTRNHKIVNPIDYKRKYSLINSILLFFTFSFVGWVWEVSLHLVKDGVFVNRGTMYGPWLPIYGIGGLLILLLLKKTREKPALTFLLTMVVCGIVEYFTSWFLETTEGERWWDYSGYLLNINGRICLEGLLVFALGGMAFIYILAPLFDDLYNKIPMRIRMPIVIGLLVAFSVDFTYSNVYPNTGKGITDYGYNDLQTKTAEIQSPKPTIKRLN